MTNVIFSKDLSGTLFDLPSSYRPSLATQSVTYKRVSLGETTIGGRDTGTIGGVAALIKVKRETRVRFCLVSTVNLPTAGSTSLARYLGWIMQVEQFIKIRKLWAVVVALR